MLPVSLSNCILDSKETQQEGLKISVFPNPAKELVTIEKGGGRFDFVTLSTADGTVLDEINIDAFLPTNTIEISHIPKGLYFLTLKGEQITVAVKLVKI
jgi:hypothetical protein